MADAGVHVTVRLLGPGDEAVLLGALRTLYDRHPLSGAAGFLARPTNRVFLAHVEDQAAAFALCYDLDRLDGARMRLIYEVGTSPQFRRRGVGRALLKAVETDARSRGISKMWVPTSRSNEAAVALYESSGGMAEIEDEVSYTWRFARGSGTTGKGGDA
jgi:ribosomal protein S18 acetylase RimI-like enzyme